MGDLETRVLGDDLAAIKVEKPIYVTSLARSGTKQKPMEWGLMVCI